MVRAVIYTRISWGPGGQRTGVERQRADCEALCADRAWEVAHYFEDNDRSAYSGKRRAAYERLLGAVDEGRIDAVVTWHNDRLHRSPRELEAFIDLVERSGVRVAVVSGGDYDLTTPEGRFTARIVGAVGCKEWEDRSRRVRRKHLELAEQGRPASHLGWGVRNEAEPAVWEGAIDRRTWDLVRAVLLNPERLTLGNTGASRRRGCSSDACTPRGSLRSHSSAARHSPA